MGKPQIELRLTVPMWLSGERAAWPWNRGHTGDERRDGRRARPRVQLQGDLLRGARLRPVDATGTAVRPHTVSQLSRLATTTHAKRARERARRGWNTC
eukprot:2955464-Prymnesium_polylepis.2